MMGNTEGRIVSQTGDSLLHTALLDQRRSGQEHYRCCSCCFTTYITIVVPVTIYGLLHILTAIKLTRFHFIKQTTVYSSYHATTGHLPLNANAVHIFPERNKESAYGVWQKKKKKLYHPSVTQQRTKQLSSTCTGETNSRWC